MDPDETAHYESSHLDLQCLQIQLLCVWCFKGKNEKRDNKQCLLDTPRRVTVNNKRLISKCKKSEKKYAYLQKPWHY